MPLFKLKFRNLKYSLLSLLKLGEQPLGTLTTGAPKYQRDSIEAHLTIAFAAPNWSAAPDPFIPDRRLDQEASPHRPRYLTIEIQASARTITTGDQLPSDLHDALERTHRRSDAH
jgi:hypothetical protein